MASRPTKVEATANSAHGTGVLPARWQARDIRRWFHYGRLASSFRMTHGGFKMLRSQLSSVAWRFGVAAWLLAAMACSEDATSGKSTNTPPVDTEAAKWLALPEVAPTIYTPGSDTQLAQATIDAAGGTLSAPAESVFAGVEVSIPAGAVSEPTVFSLGQRVGGSFANVPEGMTMGPVLALNSNGAHRFPVPLMISRPYTDPSTIPVPFYLSPDGTLKMMAPEPLDHAGGRTSFKTYHLSDFSWANTDPNNLKAVMTGFDPGVHGFAFNNQIADEYAPAGRCVGISFFSRWYRQSYGAGLYGKYQAAVPSKAKSKQISGEEVLATRAHLSVYRNNATMYVDPLPETLTAIMAGIAVGDDVVVGISCDNGTSAHAMLAIAFTDNQIAFYDSNHPTQWKAADYTLNVAANTAKLDYGDRTQLNLFSELPQEEGFAAILRDADARFHDENQTKVEITSHQKGDTVDTADITLSGKLHSGQVLVREATFWVQYPDGSESERQILTFDENNKDFDVPLKLVDGKNRIMVTSRGYLIGDPNPAKISTDIEKEEEKFELEYDLDGKKGNLTFEQSNLWGSFSYEGDAELFCDGPDSPDGGNGDYIDYTQWTVQGTLTNKTTFATNENGSPCTLVTGATQPINAGVTFRVWKTDPPTAQFLSLNILWSYECEDGNDIGGLLMYNTRTGGYCAQLATVPVDDLDSPAGSYTMDCMNALQPEIGVITGSWSFQP